MASLTAPAAAGKQPVQPVEFNSLPGLQTCSICHETDENNFVSHNGNGGNTHPLHDHCLKQSLQNRKVCPVCTRPVKMESVVKRTVDGLGEQLARDYAEIEDLKGRLSGVEGERDSLQLLLNEQTQANGQLQAQIPQLQGQVAQLNAQAGQDAQSIVNLTEQRNNIQFYSTIKTIVLIACVAILAAKTFL